MRVLPGSHSINVKALLLPLRGPHCYPVAGHGEVKDIPYNTLSCLQLHPAATSHSLSAGATMRCGIHNAAQIEQQYILAA